MLIAYWFVGGCGGPLLFARHNEGSSLLDYLA